MVHGDRPTYKVKERKEGRKHSACTVVPDGFLGLQAVVEHTSVLCMINRIELQMTLGIFLNDERIKIMGNLWLRYNYMHRTRQYPTLMHI